MRRIVCSLILGLAFWASSFFPVLAWEGMPLPPLSVEGRYLTDTHGNVVNLHGFAQTYSPWFNEQGTKWSDYDVAGCLTYNQGLIDDILDAGWMMNFVRLHMDPYWSNTPGCTPDGHELPNCFNEDRFRKYLDEVFIPMAEYAISKGLYVIMRPPGVSPEVIGVEDEYNYAEYLMTVWDIVSSHPRIRDRHEIMFELANEPVRIKLADGSVGDNTQAHFDVLKEIFQPIVNRIRSNGFHSVLWIPGSGYQSQYKGYAVNPIEGPNIGYAVHLYPGWFGSANGYEVFKAEWEEQVKPIADVAPIVITEMDWAPEKYNSSWGKGITGTAGGEGFGANFKRIMDETGNASWLLFTDPHLLARFTGKAPEPGEPYTFLNDPEACPWPVYHWYQDYALEHYPRPEFEKQSQSDNNDGSYTNPVIYADFPDPDVIRVGDVYYMVSTTMFVFPGATLLKSYDLVNWEYCAHPLERISGDDAYSLLNGENRYGRGQWATSLRYNNGTFYLLFNTLDDGCYLLTATDPEKEWTTTRLPRGFYDPGLFFDEDGKTYVVHGINTLKLTELDQNFAPIGSDVVLVERADRGLEGSHVYKIGDYYYIYATYGGWPASQVAFRSTNIQGPYEEKVLLDDQNIHQGALIETQTGEWWTLMFYDRGAIGRLPNLQPVNWVDGWPEIGVDDKGVAVYRKPDVGRSHPVKVLPTNDPFRAYRLGMQWGWNHYPDPDKYSLFDRPGHLRLYTASVSDDLWQARNTLTQRIFGYHESGSESYGTIKMDVSGMESGDRAGLAVFQDPYAAIGVEAGSGDKHLFFDMNGTITQGPALEQDVVYLRAVAAFGADKARFYYSLDNQSFLPLGEELDMAFNLSVFTGNKFGLFSYATSDLGGYVDIDWFSTEETFNEDLFYDPDFVGYSEEALTVVRIFTPSEHLEMLMGTSKSFEVFAEFADGSVRNIAAEAEIQNSSPGTIALQNGMLLARGPGRSLFQINYEGLLGGTHALEVEVCSSVFPLVEGLLNPSIWENGSFDAETGTLITGPYGFGGWQYDNGVDLSGYRYLVVNLQEPAGGDASFRLFDQGSYWSPPVEYPVGSATQVVVDLQAMYKTVDGQQVKANPATLSIIGFWSLGGSPIVIDEVYLSNSDDLLPVGLHDAELVPQKPTDEVDVFSLTGILLREKVLRGAALEALPSGLYLVGNRVQGYEKVYKNN